MATYIALLRGINVSGHRPVTMAPLRSSLETIDLRAVVTYKASGNVVFDSDSKSPSGLAGRISDVIAEDFGHDDVEVVVLRGTDLRRIESANPLSQLDLAFLHVTFPFSSVKKGAFEKLDLPTKGDERAVSANRVLYLHCPHGYGDTKINNAYFEKALGVPCTTRNWKTVVALMELVASR